MKDEVDVNIRDKAGKVEKADITKVMKERIQERDVEQWRGSCLGLYPFQAHTPTAQVKLHCIWLQHTVIWEP